MILSTYFKVNRIEAVVADEMAGTHLQLQDRQDGRETQEYNTQFLDCLDPHQEIHNTKTSFVF